MLNIVQAIADRIREQASEYAELQARIGARTLAGLTDPFGIVAAMSVLAPAVPAGGRNSQPPRPKSRRRRRRKPGAAEPRRQGRHPALKVA